MKKVFVTVIWKARQEMFVSLIPRKQHNVTFSASEIQNSIGNETRKVSESHST